jgi:hypothetical protein
MDWHVLKIPFRKDLAYCVESPGPSSDEVYPWHFTQGMAVNRAVGPLSMKTDKEHGRQFLDAIPCQGLELIFSPRCKQVLETIGLDNLQFFPVTVRDHFSKKKFEYWVCNVVGLVPCLDRTRAEVDWDKAGARIFMLKRLALDEAAISRFQAGAPCQLKIFRLAESDRYVIVHADVKNAVLAAGLTGIEFRSPEQAGDFLP